MVSEATAEGLVDRAAARASATSAVCREPTLRGGGLDRCLREIKLPHLLANTLLN
mgnify:CR=1 FL=1